MNKRKLLATFASDDGGVCLKLFKGDEVSSINMKDEKFIGKALEVDGDCLYVETETGPAAFSVFTKDNVTVDINNGRIFVANKEE